MPNYEYKDLPFIDLLEDSEQLAQQDDEQLRNALDALLQVDLMNSDPLRVLTEEEKEQVQRDLESAIIDHAEFWRSYSPDLFKYDDDDSEIDFEEEWLFSENQSVFTSIKEKAAEQRVALGLKNANDDILISILSNNKEECRAYLASKPELGQLNALPTWRKDKDIAIGPGIVKPQNTSEDMLTDEAIGNIQMKASKLLLSKLIENCQSTELLVNLLNASNQKDLLKAAKALLPLEAADVSFSLPSIEDDVDEYYEKELSVKTWERFARLTGEAAKMKFETYLQELGQPGKPDILSQKIELEKTNDDFRDAVCPGLADDDINWAKGQLGARYLQAYLPTQKKDALVAIFNAGTPETMINEIKMLTGDHDYVTHAVTEENLNSLRSAMTHSIISQASGAEQTALFDIVKADNLDALKIGLKLLGINQLDWVKETDMKALKQSALSRNFQIQASNASQLGAGVHPQLLEAFKQLPPEKQIEIIGEKDKPNNLHHLLQAKDAGAVRHYLGQGIADSVVEEIIQENKNAALYNGIHNGAIAKILANMKPPIQLNSIKIGAINQALAKAVNPNIDTKYATLIQEIKTQCTGVDSLTFNKAFGLAEDGLALHGAPVVPNAIKKQQLNNVHVRAEYNEPNHPEAIKKFTGVVLNLEKDELMSLERIKALETVFGKATNLQNFIDLAFPSTPPLSAHDKNLKARFINEFTSTLFNQLKAELRQENLINPDPIKANQSIKMMMEQIQVIHDDQKSLNQSKRNEYKPLLDVNPIHLMNPSFQGKIKNEAVKMKKDYQGKDEECNLAIDLLRRNKAILESTLASLPAENVIHPDPAIQAKIQELRKNANNELAEVNENLDFYTQVQAKITVIIQQIDKAGTQNYNYLEDGVEIRSFEIGQQLPRRVAEGASGASVTTALSPGNGRTIGFLLQDKPEEGKIKVFDVTHNRPPVPVSFGRFTEQHSQINQPNIVTSKNNEVTKTPAGKYQILQFPTAVDPANAEKSLTQAKVNFSMIMAAQILANLEGPPTKDKPLTLTGENQEEMRYLWTALVVLGEKTPHMKFGVDAIKVNSGSFNPKNELGTLWGFSSDSLRNQVFTKEAVKTSVDQKQQQLAEITKQKFDPEDKSKAEKVMKIKDGLGSMKEKAQKAINEEGPAPEQTTPSNTI